jgi:hypothetical protein
LVEEAFREQLLRLLLDPPVGSEVRDVGLLGRASPGDEQPDDAAVPVNHYGARVAGGREGAVLVAVRVDGDLDRRLLDAVLRVPANKRLNTSEATESAACGLSVLDDDQTLLAVGIEVLRLADLVVLDASDPEEPAGGVLEVGPAPASG